MLPKCNSSTVVCDFIWKLSAGLDIFLDPQAAALLGSTAEGKQAYANYVKFDSMAALQKNRRPIPRMENLFSLPVLLTHFANFASTNPRDKVFALQGMTIDLPNEAFRPDYTKTVREVYVNIAKYLLSGDNPFSGFAFAGIGCELVSRDWDLPSWVLDWESPLSCAPLNMPIKDNFSEDGYHCSGNSTARISFDVGSAVLVMEGLLIDDIKLLSRTFDDRTDNKDCFVKEGGSIVHYAESCNASYQLHQEALAMAMSGGNQLYTTTDAVIDAFWRTLVGDRIPMRRPAPPALASDYANWVEATEYEHLHLASSELSIDTLKRHFQSLSDFGSAIGSCAVGRRFCVTEKGYFGMVPPKSEVGDKICVFLGARTPFVLRREGEGYKLVGESYVHQIMDGEMMRVGLPVESIQLQ